MNTQSPQESITPFRLVKYFTFTGLIVIFLVTIILSVLNTHWVKSMQRQKSEDYAHSLIENLNHQVFIQVLIPMELIFGRIQLSTRKQFERMDMVVRGTLHSFKDSPRRSCASGRPRRQRFASRSASRPI